MNELSVVCDSILIVTSYRTPLYEILFYILKNVTHFFFKPNKRKVIKLQSIKIINLFTTNKHVNPFTPDSSSVDRLVTTVTLQSFTNSSKFCHREKQLSNVVLNTGNVLRVNAKNSYDL